MGTFGMRRVAARRVSRDSLNSCFRCPRAKFPSAIAVLRFLSSTTASDGPDGPLPLSEVKPRDKERVFDAAPADTPSAVARGPKPRIAIPSITSITPAITSPARSAISTGSVRKLPNCDDEDDVEALQTIQPSGLDVNDGHPGADVSCATVPPEPLDEPLPPPGSAGTFPFRNCLYAPLVNVPHAVSPCVLNFCTANLALVNGSAQFGDGGVCVPVDICHNPKLDCVPPLSVRFSALELPPDSASAIAAISASSFAGPPACSHSASSWEYDSWAIIDP